MLRCDEELPATWRRAAWLSAAAGIALTAVVSVTQLLPGEERALRWFATDAGPLLGPVAALLDDAFTDLSATMIFAVLVPLVLWYWGRFAGLTFLLAGAATALARLGNLVGRPRPNGRLEWSELTGAGGYPSGHVVYFVLVFGVIAHLAWTRRTPPARLVAFACAALIALVGPTRLTALDHWPADVVGAYLLAFPTLVTVVHIGHRAERRWSVPATGGQRVVRNARASCATTS